MGLGVRFKSIDLRCWRAGRDYGGESSRENDGVLIALMQQSIPGAKLFAGSVIIERYGSVSVTEIPSYMFCICCDGIDT